MNVAVNVAVAVDRIEGELAILCLADGRTFELPADLLPTGVGEGDWLRLTMAPDPEAEEAARALLSATRARLAADDDGGDFAL